MKKIGIIIALAFSLFLGLTMLKSCSNINYVTQEEFRETHQKLNLRIDTMQRKLDDLKFLVNTIDTTTKRIDLRLANVENSLDTLKAGQILIYDELTNYSPGQTKQSFIDNLINWLQ